MSNRICSVALLFAAVFIFPVFAGEWDIKCRNCLVLDCNMEQDEMCPVLKDVFQLTTDEYINYNGLLTICDVEDDSAGLDKDDTLCLRPYGFDEAKCAELTGIIYYTKAGDYPIAVAFQVLGCPGKKLLQLVANSSNKSLLLQEEKFQEGGISFTVNFQVSGENLCSNDKEGYCFPIRNVTYTGKHNPVAWAATICKCIYFGNTHCKHVFVSDIVLLILTTVILFGMTALIIAALCTNCQFY